MVHVIDMVETMRCIFCLEEIREGEELIDAWFGHEPEAKFKVHKRCAILEEKKRNKVKTND